MNISHFFSWDGFESTLQHYLFAPLIETESIAVHFRIHPANPIRSHIINKFVEAVHAHAKALFDQLYFGSLPTILVKDKIGFICPRQTQNVF